MLFRISIQLHLVMYQKANFGKGEVKRMQKNINLNTATYVGIDCHPTEHGPVRTNVS